MCNFGQGCRVQPGNFGGKKKILFFQTKESGCYAPTRVSHWQGLPYGDRISQAFPPLG